MSAHAQVAHHVRDSHTCATQTSAHYSDSRRSSAQAQQQATNAQAQQLNEQTQPQTKVSPFDTPRTAHGVLMIIRFPASQIQAFKNSVVRSGSILRNYGGTLISLGEQVRCVEGDWKEGKWCVGVVSFKKRQQAELWYASDPISSNCKQGDWLDGADFICVPLYTTVPEDKCVIQVMDCKMREGAAFFNEYVPNTTDLMVAHGATPCVAASDGSATELKGSWETGSVFVHMWPSKAAFSSYYNSDEYRTWCDFRNAVCCHKCEIIVFENDYHPRK